MDGRQSMHSMAHFAKVEFDVDVFSSARRWVLDHVHRRLRVAEHSCGSSANVDTDFVKQLSKVDEF